MLTQSLVIHTTTSKLPELGYNQRTIKDLYRMRETPKIQTTQKITKYLKIAKSLSDARRIHVKGSDVKTEYPVTLYAPYLMENPTLCSSVQDLKVLVVVHTAPSHFERRNSMRHTWTNSTYLKSLKGNLRVLFLLGRVKDANIQKKLENEFRVHKDLLQGDFIDAYRNLSHKGVMGFKWISERCKNAKFILKVDDDVVVNTYQLYMEILPRFENKSKQIFCNHILPGTMPILRNKKSKWYVNEKFFKGQKYYPRYCSGFMVLFTNDVIPAIYRSASMTPFFWVDDVYLYGLVPSGVPGIKYNGLRKKRFELTAKKAVACYRNGTLPCNFLVTGAKATSAAEEVWPYMIKQYAKKQVLERQRSNVSVK